MTASAGAGALRRVVGLPGAVLLGLGSILGTGVFVSLGLAAEAVGPAMPVALVAAGLVAACNGLSSAQLAAAHPVSGGTYEYAHRTGMPLLGFVAGWTFVCAKTASAATAALGFAGYVLLPLGIESDPARVALALVAVGAITALVAGGISRSSAGNAWIVAVTITGLVALVAAGAAGGRLQGWGDVTAGTPPDVSSWMRATAILFVAYAGYGRIATLGEEVRAPARTIPRAIVVTLGLTVALYLGVAVVALGAVGADGLARATRASAAPLEAVAAALGLSGLTALVAVAAVTAMLGVLLNLVLGVSRVMVAMARRGDLPRGLAGVDVASGSPRVAVVATGALVLVLAATGSVRATWSFSAFTVLLYYAITNLAALRQPASERRVPRLVPAFGLVACLALAPSVGTAAWIAGCVLVLSGWVGRFLWAGGQRA